MPDPDPNIDHEINSSNLDPQEQTDLHKVPVPKEYDDFVEAWRFISYMVDYGVVTVVENESDISPSEQSGRVVVVKSDEKMLVDGDQLDMGGSTIDHIADLADGSDTIELIDPDTGNQITMTEGTLEPDKLILPEL